MPLRIDYESEGFVAGAPVANGKATLVTSWGELLWAALTVGRPNRQYVFQHGTASFYEALFRLSLVRMALEQAGPLGSRFYRTTAARTLDPSEKGAVNYFIGLAVCKLFAARLLNVPWLMHLDVFRPTLNAVLTGRSRPDLVGETLSGDWLTLECKGRLSRPSEAAKERAKQQAQRVVSINGIAPTFCVGGITYLRNDVLQFYWRDPPSEPRQVKRPIQVAVEQGAIARAYAPVLELIRSAPDYLLRMQREPVLLPIEQADVSVGIHPNVLRAALESNWDEVRRQSRLQVGQSSEVHYQLDGIVVIPGKSWLQRFEDHQE